MPRSLVNSYILVVDPLHLYYTVDQLHFEKQLKTRKRLKIHVFN